MFWLRIKKNLGLISRKKFEEIAAIKSIEDSKYFDKKWYLKTYPDVARAKLDPLEHYLKYGWKEGRNPSKKFNTKFYLDTYKDVKKAGINPLIHYLKHGKKEGRKCLEKKPLSKKLFNHSKKTPNDYNILKKSKYFNKKWYLKTYPDVARAKLDPIEHYLNYGWKEGRNPSKKFNSNWYLSRYADVKKAGINPLIHYLKHGKKEGRSNIIEPSSKYIKLFKLIYTVTHHKTSKKVLLLTHELSYTGAPLSLLQAAICLKDKGYNICIVSLLDGELKKEFKKHKIKVKICHATKIKKLLFMASFYDIAIVNTLVPYQQFSLLSKIIPTIWWIREGVNLLQNNPEMLSAFKNAKNLYAMSPYSRTEFLEYNSNIKVLKHGIPDKYRQKAINGDKIIFSLIGTIGTRKGQDIFVKAIKALPEKIREKAEFCIVGHVIQKDFYKDLKKLMEGIPEIKLLPEISNFSDMLDYYENISCVVVPSREEPTSRVVLEAMMMGRPAIISDHVGAKYVIKEGKNGFVFESENTEHLAECLKNFIKQYKNILNMQEEARKSYLENNTIEELSENLNTMIQDTKPLKHHFFSNKPNVKYIKNSKYFDEKWYLATYPDVKKSGMDPALHYLNYGWKEGRNPSKKFNTNNYIEQYADVKRANINPLLHWEKSGKREHRKANISVIRNKDYYEGLPFCKYKSELELWYKRVTKNKLDLNKPKTFNEKIQWLKLYDSTPIKTLLADKYLVRDWIKEKIGEEYLIPLLGVYDSFDEIDFDKLPNQFVIKCNHGSGYNIIVKDKTKLDLKDIKEKLDLWMGSNFAFSTGFELQYLNMKPKIIIEQFMDGGTDDLQDYKVMCFNGKPEFIWVDTDRSTDHKRNFFTLNWKEMNVKMCSKYNKKKNIPQPINLKKMISLAKTLSTGFCVSRIDFYEIENKLYFGEVTFTSASGIEDITPTSFDKYLGSLIKLPKKVYDIDRGIYCDMNKCYPQRIIDIQKIIDKTPQKASKKLSLSIVIPIYNALQDVKLCIQSLLNAKLEKQTEIILVDDCSRPETNKYLQSFVKKHKNFKLHRNKQNSGFIKTSNKGIDLAKRDIVVVLNSDTKVPVKFDRYVLDCFESDQNIAVASPLSTHSGLFTINENDDYDLNGIQKKIVNTIKPVYPLITPEGFCLCLRKSIIEKIGKLDEIYGMGYREEDDLILRALQNGYKTVLIDNLIVFHKAHASFTSEKRLQILQNNTKIFRRRWGTLQSETRNKMDMMNLVKRYEKDINALIGNTTKE